MSIHQMILDDIERGDRESAQKSFGKFLDEIEGPERGVSGKDDPIRRLNLEFTVWEQIEIYNREVDRRPENPRSWKLLGYAYMCAGLYVPVLFYLAGHCLHASIARDDDNSLIANLTDKIEVIENARRGDIDSREELLKTEAGLALAFEDFPESVPVPFLFHENDIVAVREIEINEANLAADLLGEELDEIENDDDEISEYDGPDLSNSRG